MSTCWLASSESSSLLELVKIMSDTNSCDFRFKSKHILLQLLQVRMIDTYNQPEVALCTYIIFNFVHYKTFISHVHVYTTCMNSHMGTVSIIVAASPTPAIFMALTENENMTHRPRAGLSNSSRKWIDKNVSVVTLRKFMSTVGSVLLMSTM